MTIGLGHYLTVAAEPVARAQEGRGAAELVPDQAIIPSGEGRS